MPIQTVCPNPACGKSYEVNDELAGKKVRCKQCQTVIWVPRLEVHAPAASDATGGKELPQHHPARLVCTNCGAVLGVRDAVCPKCGGDVRSGITVMRISAEEKARHGLFFRRKGKSSPMARVALLMAALIILVGLGIAAAWLVQNWSSFRTASAEQPVQTASVMTP